MPIFITVKPPATIKLTRHYPFSIINFPFAMNIVLFGGSFNPPHLGHQIVLTQAFELIPNVDEVWLLPTHHHTFGKHHQYASDHHRLAMTKYLLSDKVKLCPIEIDLKLSGETIDTIHQLKSHPKYSIPNTKYSFLMGSDNLPSFTKWGSWEKLLDELPFFVYPRAGFPFQPLYDHMTPLESPLQVVTNISSTLIRNRLQKNLPIHHLVPPSIEQYITSHNLYPGLTTKPTLVKP